MYQPPNTSKSISSLSAYNPNQSHTNHYQQNRVLHSIQYLPFRKQDCQAHQLLINKQLQLDKQLEIFQWRSEQQPFIVKPCCLQISEGYCNYKILRIFTEKPKLLSDIQPKLTFSEAVKIFLNCLKGFKCLFQKFGMFVVNEQMISVDSNKIAKVWINRDFSKNYYTSSINANQPKTIKTIFSAIFSNLSKKQIPKSFSSLIQEQKSFTNTILLMENSFIISQFSRRTSADVINPHIKYFQKSPKNIDQTSFKKNNLVVSKMKQSMAVQRQPSFKQLISKPEFLEFKQKHVSKVKSRREDETETNRFQLKVFSPDNSEYKNAQTESLYSPKNIFLQRTPKNKRKFFTSCKNSFKKFEQKSDQKTQRKYSCSSKTSSFSSNKINRTNYFTGGNSLKPSSIFQSSNKRRTGSTFNRSPSPNHCLEVDSCSLQVGKQSNPTTKSMTVFNKEIQIPKSFKSKDCTGTSSKDFDFESSQTLGFDRLQRTSRRFSGGLQFNTDVIHESIIQNDYVQESKIDIISQLKHSVFNRIDDLKQSQIIMQSNQQQSIINSKTSIADQSIVEGQNEVQIKKNLRKISIKPMVQSITFLDEDDVNERENESSRHLVESFVINQKSQRGANVGFNNDQIFRSISERYNKQV